MKKILLYGYGNPGRQDDGLGPALIDIIEKSDMPGVSCDSNYQLNIEDAYDVARYDAVIFVDASTDTKDPFTFNSLKPAHEISFTTHAISASSVLALCEDMYGKSVEAYIMAIRGYAWEFNEPITQAAMNNLQSAASFIRDWIHTAQTG